MPVINRDASTTDTPPPLLNKPKYKPGDWVKVNDPGDSCRGKEMQIERVIPEISGKSPLRYSLWGSDKLYTENLLEPAEV